MTKSIAQIRADLAEWLETHALQHGVGNLKRACSVAAMNIAESGRVTDECPDCMCPVLHSWIMPVQVTLPLGTGPYDLNGPRWKSALILAAGTNDGRGAERLAIIMDWMWGVVLPQVQRAADRYGFGDEWRRMCEERTMGASEEAWVVSRALELAGAAELEVVAAAAEAAWSASLMPGPRAAADVGRAASRALGYHPAYFAAIDAPGLLERLVNLPERSAA